VETKVLKAWIYKTPKRTGKIINDGYFEMRNDLTNYEADLLADLADPKYAAMYVSTALEDGCDAQEFLLALRDVADARTMSKVAEDANLNRVSLYKILRESGNPRLASLRSLLQALGLRLSIVAIEDSEDKQPIKDSVVNHEHAATMQPKNILSGAIALAVASLAQPAQRGTIPTSQRRWRGSSFRKMIRTERKPYKTYARRAA